MDLRQAELHKHFNLLDSNFEELEMCLVAMEVGALRLRQVFTVVLKKFTVEFNTMVLNSHYYTKYARLEFINQWSRVKTKLEYLIWKTSFSFRLIKKKKIDSDWLTMENFNCYYKYYK